MNGSSRSRGWTWSILFTAATAGRPVRSRRLSDMVVFGGPMQRFDHEDHKVRLIQRGGRGAVHGPIECATLDRDAGPAYRRRRSAHPAD